MRRGHPSNPSCLALRATLLALLLAAGCASEAVFPDGGGDASAGHDRLLLEAGSPVEVGPPRDGGPADGNRPVDRQAAADAPASWTWGTGGPTGDSLQTLAFGGHTRSFAVHAPPGLQGQGVPLLLHFHGFRNLPAGVQNELAYVWRPTASTGGFIAVAPEGLPCPELNMGSNVGCFQETRDGPFVAALAARLGQLYNIDRQRVALSGHSGGAFFVQSLGLASPAIYAAAVEFSGGCVAKAGYMNDCGKYEGLSAGAARKLPLFVAHNKNDTVVPAAESASLLAILQKNGHPTSHLDTYNGGSTGHAIDPAVVPQIWTWLAGFRAP